MSTLATAKFDASDSEGDEDFVPTELSTSRKKSKQGSKRKAEAGINATAGPSKRSKPAPAATAENDDVEEASATDSGSSDDEEGEDEGNVGSIAEMDAEAAKLRAEAEEAEAEERRRRAKETFLSFQQDNNGQPDGQDTSATPPSSAKMVEVRRARVFAGETIYETVSLPETDPEAVAFLAKQKEEAETASHPPATSSSTASGPEIPVSTTKAAPEPAGTSADSAQAKASETSTSPISSTAAAPVPKPAFKGGPPRRRPRQSLEAMASALGKGKKMTTLEKSQHDWKAHLAGSQAEKDELEANRRSGGFLEKRDFLDRVGNRRSQAFEQNGKR